MIACGGVEDLVCKEKHASYAEVWRCSVRKCMNLRGNSCNGQTVSHSIAFGIFREQHKIEHVLLLRHNSSLQYHWALAVDKRIFTLMSSQRQILRPRLMVSYKTQGPDILCFTQTCEHTYTWIFPQVPCRLPCKAHLFKQSKNKEQVACNLLHLPKE